MQRPDVEVKLPAKEQAKDDENKAASQEGDPFAMKENPFRDANAADIPRLRQEFIEMQREQAEKKNVEQGAKTEEKNQPAEKPRDKIIGSDKAVIDADWDKERQKLMQWEQTGQLPEAKLPHLTPLIGKVEVTEGKPSAAEDALNDAAESAAEAAQKKKERAQKLLADHKYQVENPAFEDHANAEFACDGCKTTRARHQYTKQQLRKLGDVEPEQRPPGAEGPYRGMLIRLHEKGYGFIECPQLFAIHNRDVFIQSALVEQLMGGPRAVQIAIEDKGTEYRFGWGKSRANFGRVEFFTEIKSNMQVVAKAPVGKLKLVCKFCEKRQQQLLQRRQMEINEIANQAGQPAPSMAKPLHPGFNPQAALQSALGSYRGAVGLPAPNAPGAVKTPALRGLCSTQVVHSEMYSKNKSDILSGPQQQGPLSLQASVPRPEGVPARKQLMPHMPGLPLIAALAADRPAAPDQPGATET